MINDIPQALVPVQQAIEQDNYAWGGIIYVRIYVLIIAVRHLIVLILCFISRSAWVKQTS